MSTVISLDYFQTNYDRLFKDISETGIPAEIEYKGKKFVISIAETDKLSNLKPHPDCIEGDPEDIVQIDWSGEWKYDLP